MCFDFFVQFLSETFLFLSRIPRDIFINVHRSLGKLPLFIQIRMELEYAERIFEKNLKYQIS